MHEGIIVQGPKLANISNWGVSGPTAIGTPLQRANG